MKHIKQAGLTLIELMIALVLSSVIIAGIIQVFLANREAYNLTESLVRVQENGRFAMSFITTALRQSGNYGCVPEIDLEANNIQSQVDAEIPDINTIQTNAVATLGNTTNGAAVTDSFDAPDTLTLMVTTNNTAQVASATNATTLAITDGASFEEDDYVLVSNCQVGDFIKLAANSNAAQIVDATGGMRTNFYEIANLVSTVTEVQFVHYFVDDDALNVRTINPADGSRDTQVLLNGIENIQFTYGVDSNDDYVVDYFDDIDAVSAEGHVPNIVAVKIFVLAVSGGDGDRLNVVTEEQTLVLNGQTATMPDGDLRLRKVFESTVSLRNRMN